MFTKLLKENTVVMVTIIENRVSVNFKGELIFKKTLTSYDDALDWYDSIINMLMSMDYNYLHEEII